MNVLVALAWPNHVHSRFGTVHRDGWATCPATEAGFVRVSSNTRVLRDARPPAEAIALLCEIRGQPGHHFWSDDVSPCQDTAGLFARVVGYGSEVRPGASPTFYAAMRPPTLAFLSTPPPTLKRRASVERT